MQAANCIGVEKVGNNEGVICTKSVETDLVQEYLNLSTVKVRIAICSCGSEANLCRPSSSLVLLAPFVWLMSGCDALPIVLLSEPHTPSTLPLSNSHEVMS